MRFNGSIFEERMTTIRQTSQMDINSLREYVSSCKSDYYSELEKRVLRSYAYSKGLLGFQPMFIYKLLYILISIYITKFKLK
ncbi:MAG: hypothetical protein Lokiarch_53620 [Candidatus Lokiarchaeum sp. GC14_75]|nr:MAG: hypothetical protein Lokiarch_53620 [Candidatus Lokiarchaeum sp. GC14_75]